MKAMLYKKSGVFNIGSGKSYSVKEIVKKIISLYEKDIKVKYLKERRKNEIMDCFADISKAKKELDWQPRIPLDEGLKRVIDNSDRGLL